MDIGLKEITEWHLARGFNSAGYHDIIRRDGTLEFGRDENQVGAHVKGYNSRSVGICMVGGKDDDGSPVNNFTPEQFKTLRRCIKFHKALHPDAQVVGHSDLNPHKACPCFDVVQWVKDQL